ncbi:MAG: hypothetical protein LBR21_10605 [Propionibacteriaceae bacterium]|jgi:hypothetical protein|nr:hypothetical protein [Propionibacteriaceae bacterium]
MKWTSKFISLAAVTALSAGLLMSAPAAHADYCDPAAPAEGCTPLEAAPKAKSKVTIVGTAKVGKTLKAKVAAKKFKWNVKKVSTSYQWYVGDQLVKNGASYKIKAKDAGQKIKLVAVGTKEGYNTATKASSKKKIPALSATIKISGLPKNMKMQTNYYISATVKAGNVKVDGSITITFKGRGNTRGSGNVGYACTSKTPLTEDECMGSATNTSKVSIPVVAGKTTYYGITGLNSYTSSKVTAKYTVTFKPAKTSPQAKKTSVTKNVTVKR